MSRIASANTCSVCNAPFTLDASPNHDTNVIASASQPGHDASAPNTTNTITPTTCTASWIGASSVVSHAAKNPTIMSSPGRCGGRSDTSVHNAPQTATIKKTHATMPHQSRTPPTIDGKPGEKEHQCSASPDSTRPFSHSRRRLPTCTSWASPSSTLSTIPDQRFATFHERVRALLERADAAACRRSAAASSRCRSGCSCPRGSMIPTSTSTTTCVGLRCPAPGGEAELAAFAADIASRPLDRRKPLWEAYVVEGLEHGHQAFVSKIHHSLIDGIAGVAILAALFDMSADAPLEPAEPPEPIVAEHVPSDAEMLGSRRWSRSRSGRRRSVRALTNSVPGVVRAVRRARDESLDVALPLTAPRLSMNRTITAHRILSFSSVALADVKAVKNALGVTVNDVVLAVTAGALRSYLEGRDELPDRPLVASIPTSVRADDDADKFGNQVSSMFAALPVEIADPVERVRAVARSMSGAKGVHEAVGDSTLQDWAEVAGPALFSRASRAYSRLRVARAPAAGDQPGHVRTCPDRRGRSTSPARSSSRSIRSARSSTTAGSTQPSSRTSTTWTSASSVAASCFPTSTSSPPPSPMPSTNSRRPRESSDAEPEVR